MDIKFGDIVQYKEWDDETFVGVVIHVDSPDLMIANAGGNRLYSIEDHLVVKILGHIGIEQRIQRAERNLDAQDL